MKTIIKTYDVTHGGITFRVEFVPDYDAGLPWENSDGHGVVTEWVRRDKKPGELILNEDRQSKRFYDVTASIEKAKKERWGLSDTAGLTPKQITAKAVQQDFEYLKAFCNDEWQYIGVIVFPLTKDGDELRSKSDSLYGVEYDGMSDYPEMVARDMYGSMALYPASEVTAL